MTKATRLWCLVCSKGSCPGSRVPVVTSLRTLGGGDQIMRSQIAGVWVTHFPSVFLKLSLLFTLAHAPASGPVMLWYRRDCPELGFASLRNCNPKSTHFLCKRPDF